MPIRKLELIEEPRNDNRRLQDIPDNTWFISDARRLPMYKRRNEVLLFYAYPPGGGLVLDNIIDPDKVFYGYQEIDVEIIGKVRV